MPHRPTEALLELQKAMDAVKSAVHKMKPLKGLASKAYKKFSSGVKTKMLNMKGPYGYAYPTGHYDFVYEPEFVAAPSEQLASVVAPPADMDTSESRHGQGVFVAAPPHSSSFTMDNNLTAEASEPKSSQVSNKDRVEKHTFGYKVTIYRTPNDEGKSSS